MNKVQTNQFRMFLNTQDMLDANTTIWNGTPIIVSTKNQYDELIQRVVEKNEKTNPNSKGVTRNKDQALLNLTEKVVSLSGILQAYAAFNNDIVLAGKVKFVKSDLIRARETDIEGLINPFIDIAREKIGDLADFSVTEEGIVELETSLDDFKVLIGQPRTIRNQAFAAMTAVDELFDETNDLLKAKLDKLMIRFEFTNPEFYDEYKRARTIVG